MGLHDSFLDPPQVYTCAQTTLQGAAKLLKGMESSDVFSKPSGRLERPTYQKPPTGPEIDVGKGKGKGRRTGGGSGETAKRDKETLVKTF